MKFKRHTERKVKAVVDLTPLIDVVFQLIIFFMVTSSFVVQSGLPLNLSESHDSSNNTLEQTDLTVSLSPEPGGPDGQGRIAITGGEEEVEITSWEQLKTEFQEFAAKSAALPPDQKPTLLIRPDKDIPMQRFVSVLTEARAVGIEQYNLAAQEPTGTE